MRRLLFLVAGALLADASATPSYAQTQPDTLVWERVGTVNDVRGLFFDADTLYAAAVSDPIQVFRPGDADWSQAFPTNARARDLLITPERVVCLLVTAASGLGCSIDSLQTWYGYHDKAFTLPVRTPEDALLLGPNMVGVVAARSTDDGATWTEHGFAEGSGAEDEGLTPRSLVVIPPSEALPNGRIVAAGSYGIAYSDDDGRSWYPTELFGHLAYVAWSATRIEHGEHAGRLLAIVERGAPGGSPTGLYRSTDGIAWERITDVPGGNTFDGRLMAAPGGAVYAYDTNTAGRSVRRSIDGGETWQRVGPVWTEWPAEAREIVAGPDGRLYAACSGGGFAGYDGGVFRTVEAVFPVDAEAEPPETLGTRLEVYPNPSRGAATVALTLSEPSEVRVVVYDVLGRAVAVLHAGPLGAGEHALAFESAGLPAGVYLVRAEGSGFSAAHRLTVVR